jgi:hypothetical protein
MIGVMFVLAASIFFVCAPANATSELAESNVQTKAPESYYVSKPLLGFDDYKFYSERRYNHNYRGWLNFHKETNFGNLNYTTDIYLENLYNIQAHLVARLNLNNLI